MTDSVAGDGLPLTDDDRMWLARCTIGRQPVTDWLATDPPADRIRAQLVKFLDRSHPRFVACRVLAAHIGTDPAAGDAEPRRSQNRSGSLVRLAPAGATWTTRTDRTPDHQEDHRMTAPTRATAPGRRRPGARGSAIRADVRHLSPAHPPRRAARRRPVTAPLCRWHTDDGRPVIPTAPERR